MNYFSAKIVSSLYEKIEYDPKRWLKNELTEREQLILRHRENIRLWLNKKSWFFPLRKILDSHLQNITHKEYWSFRPPTLKAPCFFSRPLQYDLKSSLENLLETQSEKMKALPIIEKAQLDLPTPEFYTLPKAGGFLIRGHSQPTYGNLLCFAHELGHALYELDNIGDEVGSEVAAFIFEDRVASLLLQDPIDQQEWKVYKRSQDELNYFLYANECMEFEGGQSWIPENYLFFRESLVTCWGYQGLYAWASLQREFSKFPAFHKEKKNLMVPICKKGLGFLEFWV